LSLKVNNFKEKTVQDMIGQFWIFDFGLALPAKQQEFEMFMLFKNPKGS
jgi:hypothetical protein